MKEGNKSSPVHDYLIPVRLIVMQEPYGANETVPFEVQPKLMMVDRFNRTVRTLGHGYQRHWYVGPSLLSSLLAFLTYRVCHSYLHRKPVSSALQTKEYIALSLILF